MKTQKSHSNWQLLAIGCIALVASFLVTLIAARSAVSDNSVVNVSEEFGTGPINTEMFHPGPEWNGSKDGYGISQTEARNFQDYSLFWLGESFAGYNLQAIVHYTYTPTGNTPSYEAMESVTFGYGVCDVPEDATGCPVPVVVAIEPICMSLPETIADHVLADSKIKKVRGEADVLEFRDGHLRVWTGDVSVFIDAPANPALAREMLDSLAGLNTDLQRGDSLPAGDFSSCTDEFVPTWK